MCTFQTQSIHIQHKTECLPYTYKVNVRIHQALNSIEHIKQIHRQTDRFGSYAIPQHHSDLIYIVGQVTFFICVFCPTYMLCWVGKYTLLLLEQYTRSCMCL